MTLKNRLVVLAAFGAIVQSGIAFAQPHYSKTVSMVELATSTCYFFRLNGVSEADPVVPNSPWFAISKTQENAKEMYTLLLTVRTTGATLDRVVTTGTTVCGHAQVSLVDF